MITVTGLDLLILVDLFNNIKGIMDKFDVVFELGLEKVMSGLSLMVCRPKMSQVEKDKVKQLVRLLESLLAE